MSILSDLNRSQMIIPFGTGASYDYVNFSAMTMDIDSWRLPDDTIEALLIKNDRLLNYVNYLLRVKFEGPRNYKKIRGIIEAPIKYDENSTQDEKRTMRPIQVATFPKWGVCSRCSALSKFSGTNSRCKNEKYPRWLSQSCNDKDKKNGFKIEPVRFISYCSKGHIQDFPWEEYLSVYCQDSCVLTKGQANHSQSKPSMYLSDNSSGNGFASLILSCAHCKKERSLSGINEKNIRDNSLDKFKNKIFRCKGEKPWTTETSENCNLIVDVQPRGASKIYWPEQASGIYIPEETSEAITNSPEFIQILEDSDAELKTEIKLAVKYTNLSENFDLSIDEIVEIVIKERENEEKELEDDQENEDFQLDFLFKEYESLSKPEVNDEYFVSKEINIDDYNCNIPDYFLSLHKVKKLISTNVLLGFQRLSDGDENLDIKETFNPVRRETPYLPCTQVSGEGIFVNFNFQKIDNWIGNNKEFIERSNKLRKNSKNDYLKTYNDLNFHPGYILIHTFSHLLMLQLSLECGYSLTDLKEKLYFSPDHKMAGILIYTASSDSQGSLGGLVRMIEPKYFENTFSNLINNSYVCSNDPICLESNGQGYAGLDLAGCHACSMIPDLACDTFPKNVFLDRMTLIGNSKNLNGYFNEI